jgi:hypothetical protein
MGMDDKEQLLNPDAMRQAGQNVFGSNVVGQAAGSVLAAGSMVARPAANVADRVFGTPDFLKTGEGSQAGIQAGLNGAGKIKAGTVNLTDMTPNQAQQQESVAVSGFNQPQQVKGLLTTTQSSESGVSNDVQQRAGDGLSSSDPDVDVVKTQDPNEQAMIALEAERAAQREILRKQFLKIPNTLVQTGRA